MATTDAAITNSTSSKSFNFRGVSSFEGRLSQPVISIPFVNAKSTSNILFRFVGQTEDINFSFALFDDGVDVGDGAIITIDQQIDYLRTTIFTEQFDDKWTFTQGSVYVGVTCAVLSVSFQKNKGSPSLATGRISLRLGNLGAL